MLHDSSPTWDGVHVQQNVAVLVGAIRAFIAVNPQLAMHVIQHGTILQSLGVWIHIKHHATGKMGIADIHAPNSSIERIIL